MLPWRAEAPSHNPLGRIQRRAGYCVMLYDDCTITTFDYVIPLVLKQQKVYSQQLHLAQCHQLDYSHSEGRFITFSGYTHTRVCVCVCVCVCTQSTYAAPRLMNPTPFKTQQAICRPNIRKNHMKESELSFLQECNTVVVRTHILYQTFDQPQEPCV